METFTITKIKANAKEVTEDVVAQEAPFTLNLSEKELVTLLCSPFDLEDLVKGFLFTSGLIRNLNQVKRITIDSQRWSCYIELDNKDTENLVFKRLYTSGCGRGTLFYNPLDIMHRSKIVSEFKIDSNAVSRLMLDFQRRSEVYLKTGGVHSAALANKQEIFAFREDIGRHSAIDKVIGHALSQNKALEDNILITSGRISSEVVFKVKKCCIPIVISRSAATNQAVRLAREMDVTLVGFARSNKMNIYSKEERII
jgi:FdhD protein